MAGESKKITYVSLAGDETIHPAYEKALEEVRVEFGKHHSLFIGGGRTSERPEFEVWSPIDGETLIGYFQAGDEDDATQAVAAAKRAFPEWSRIGFKERVRAVRQTADIIEGSRFRLAALITYEVGKTRTEALAEVFEAVDMLRYYCDIYSESGGYVRTMKSLVTGEHCTSMMRPIGIFAVISPFNFPIALAAGMCSGALITGNTIVFKPTSEAPLSGMRLYEAFIAGGVPGGAINIVTGPGTPFGKAVAASPDVDGIAFTGSRDVGTWLYHTFSLRQRYPKPFIAEMGSKNPVIVMPSADLEKAVEGIVQSAYGYAGQKCSATSRVYVHESVASPFKDLLKARTGSVIVGDPRKRESFFGPLIDSKAARTYTSALEQAKAVGGTIVTGGEVLTGVVPGKGYYVRPVVVTGLPNDHPIMRDELFVPFLCLNTCSSLEQAVQYANNTDFGLTAGIFSRDPDEIAYFFDHIRSGVAYANRSGGATTGAWPGSQPFTGWNASGSTGKGVGGPYYLLSFVREQAQTRVT